MEQARPSPLQAPDSQPGRPKVAVVFYGITRSLKLTIGSIRRNLLDPARAIAGEVRTFGHFFDQERIDNPRSGEHGVLDRDEYRLLQLDELVQEAPGLCLEKHDFDRLKAAGDPWKDGFVSVRNLVHQLHSLDQATVMAQGWQPDIVIFARPDLYHHDPVTDALATLVERRGEEVVVPDWGRWSGYNDRLALAKGAGAIAAYGRRIRRLAGYVAPGRGAHAERFLKFAVSGLPVRMVPLRASRIRSNGMAVIENFAPGRGAPGPLGLVPFAEFEAQLSGAPAPDKVMEE